MLAAESSTLVLEGGTHNPHSPPFEFLARAFLPLLERMGAVVQATLERPGFYPAGGGRFRARVEPCAKLARLELLERGELRAYGARALVASLPRAIAERELQVVGRRLNWERRLLRSEVVEHGQGPGNVVIVELESEHVTEVFTGFGERGVAAEDVAERVATEAMEYLAEGVPVGTHLADQLLLPMALAGGGVFRSLEPSLHGRTQAGVIREFLGVEVRMGKVEEGGWVFEVGG